MIDKEIGEFKKLFSIPANIGKIYWISPQYEIHRCTGGINMDWIEFPDDPFCIAEPVAFLDTGGCVSLYNASKDDFVELKTLFGKEKVDLKDIIKARFKLKGN